MKDSGKPRKILCPIPREFAGNQFRGAEVRLGVQGFGGCAVSSRAIGTFERIATSRKRLGTSFSRRLIMSPSRLIPDKPPRDPARRQSNARPHTTPIHSTGFSWKAGRFNESYTSAPVGCTDDGSALLIHGIACQYCIIDATKGLCSTNVAPHTLTIDRCSTRCALHQLGYLRLPGLLFVPSTHTVPMPSPATSTS